MKKTTCLILFSIFYFNNGSIAQNNSIPAGGNGSGTGGTVSYSVGQISYSTKASTSGNASEGLQQPYELFLVTGIKDQSLELSISAYPNPALDLVTLNIDKYGDLSYLFTDANGKLVSQNQISSNLTEINCKELCSGVYFLKVYNKSGQLRNFKLIKNK
ncbi:MAG: hypothetical protein K0S44_671 [Bacteroidetes bacterium]|jgi:hypothetical protein|nr:hypothetical protein [Bacteroidota bacterium]